MSKRTEIELGKQSVKRAKPDSTLLSKMGDSAPAMLKSPLMLLSTDQFMRILNSTTDKKSVAQNRKDADSSDDSSDISDSPEPVPVLDHKALVELTLSCTGLANFMLKRSCYDGFQHLARLRAKSNGFETASFDFLPRFGTDCINAILQRNQQDPEQAADSDKPLIRASGKLMKNHLWSPLVHYLTTWGYPACSRCGMKCNQYMKDGTPISTFAVIRGAGKDPVEPKFSSKDEPHRRQNFAILDAWRRHTYRCINPKCGAELDDVLLNTPLGTVFDACLATAKGQSRHHDFRSWKYQLYGPNKKELDFPVKVCRRCGVLTTEKQNLQQQVKCGGQCKSERQRRGLQICLCDRDCKSCKRQIRRCRCIFCDTCKRCDGDNCSRCKKTCQCDPGYCEECGCEQCECEDY